MTPLTINWTPPANLTDHAGNSLRSDRVFFTAPPPEIGELLSADSTLEKGGKARKLDWWSVYYGLFSSVSLGFVAGLVLWVIIFLVMISLSIRDGFLFDNFHWLCLTVGFIVMMLLLRSSALMKSAVCTFVGTNGAAICEWKDNPQERVPETLNFKNAEELRIIQTVHYVNRAYLHTIYGFEWVNHNRQKVYYIGGVYHSQENKPPPEDKYHFALAAENSWSVFAYQSAVEELKRNGTVKFNLSVGDEIIVGSGFVEIHQSGKTARCSTEEIDNVIIKQGIVSLKRKDASSGFFGIGAKGIYTFSYSDLANARLFILLFDSLVGVSEQ